MLRTLQYIATTTLIGLVASHALAFDPEPAKATKSTPAAASESKSAAKTPPASSADAKRAEKNLPRRLRADEMELPTFTPEREAAALTFARRHHSELADLLDVLSKTDRDEYEQAIRELFNTSELIAKMYLKDRWRADNELERWKLNSRIQLLVARWSMNRDDLALRAELEAALEAQINLRLKALDDEKKALEERLARIKETSQQLEQNRRRAVKREIELLTGARPDAPTKTKPAEKSKEAEKSKDEPSSKKTSKPASN